MACKTCDKTVDEDVALVVYAPDGESRELFCGEECLAAEHPGRVSPGFGRENVKDQPPMIAVPAPPGYQGRTLTLSGGTAPAGEAAR